MKTSLQLIQFAKWPRRGQVKTRLEPALGQEGALNAHIRLTLVVLSRLLESGYPVALAWDRALATPPVEAAPVLNAMETSGVKPLVQQGQDLGERMTHALAVALEHADMAMIIGSDCPSVDAGYIEQAREALQQADLVFGPSDDGGYVLIGARRIIPRMLQGVEWGSERALAQSLASAREAGLRVATLAPRWDVDEPADWDRFQAMACQSPTGG